MWVSVPRMVFQFWAKDTSLYFSIKTDEAKLCSQPPLSLLFILLDKNLSLVGLFRTNQFIVNILLLIYAFLIRFPIFFNLEFPITQSRGGAIWNWIASFSWAEQGLASAIIATLLIVVQAVLLNYSENRFRLSGELNLLPGMCYILFASALPQSYFLSPLLIGMTFFIFALHEIFVCYKKFNPAIHIFNIGFWLSMAFLCYQSFWLFLIFSIIALSILLNFKLKSFFRLTAGFIVPLFLTAVIFFYQDSLNEFLEVQWFGAIHWRDWNLSDAMSNWLPLILFGIFILWALIRHGSFLIKKGIHARKSIDVLYWSMLFAGFTFFIQPGATTCHLLLAIPCLAFVFTFTLLRSSKPMAEAIHFLILGLIVIWQIGFWN